MRNPDCLNYVNCLDKAAFSAVNELDCENCQSIRLPGCNGFNKYEHEDQKSEIRSQRSEVRSQRSEVGGKQSEAGAGNIINQQQERREIMPKREPREHEPRRCKKCGETDISKLHKNPNAYQGVDMICNDCKRKLAREYAAAKKPGTNKPEAGEQKPEVGSQKSEVGNQKTEFRSQRPAKKSPAPAVELAGVNDRLIEETGTTMLDMRPIPPEARKVLMERLADRIEAIVFSV